VSNSYASDGIDGKFSRLDDLNKRGWNNGFAAGYGKRAWNSFGAAYGKRAYDDGEEDYYPAYVEYDGNDNEWEDTPEKRAWNSGFAASMGKRAWNSGFAGSMGKRAWNSGFAPGVGKRAWNSGFASMGKRAWNSGFSGEILVARIS